ncbi:MAG: acyltransferase [Pseudomonadota bacterium]|nr:acyltransferase [Pseudomonadota bacterium]MDE3038545.1 acyltransferase [Pseudomonadota bacterium]
MYFLVSLLAVAARGFAQGAASLDMALLHRFILNVTFLFGFDDPGKTSIMPGGWSIGVEWAFYFLFPLFLLFLRSLGAMIAGLAAGIVINGVTAHALLSGQTLEAAWIPYTQFPTFFVYFIAGITAAELFMRLRSRGVRPRGWLCRAVPVLALALIFLYPSHSVEEYLRGAHVAALILTAMLALIAGSLLENMTKAEVRIYSFLGEISYGTYLLFFFVYNAVQIALKHFYPGYPFALLVVTSASGTLLLSYLVYRFYEMPARRSLNTWGRRLLKEGEKNAAPLDRRANSM